MKTPATTAVTPVHATPPRRGFFTRVLHWILDIDDITPEEARNRMRSSPGFFASLTAEQLEMMRNYDGPENLGPPITERQLRRIVKRLSKP